MPDGKPSLLALAGSILAYPPHMVQVCLCDAAMHASAAAVFKTAMHIDIICADRTCI